MLNPNNNITISGGITREPEIIKEGLIVKFSLAVDGSSNDKENPTGYFDIVFFPNNSQASDWFMKQLKEGKIKKGSQLFVSGRIVQERWSSDEGSKSKVSVYANEITYASSKFSSSKSEPSSAKTSVSIDDF